MKRHGRTGLDFGVLTTTRVVWTRGLRPRPNRSGVLFKEDLVLVGELCRVEDSYAGEKDVAAEGVCVETSVVFDSSKAEAETTKIVERGGAVSWCINQQLKIERDPILCEQRGELYSGCIASVVQKAKFGVIPVIQVAGVAR